MLRASLHALCIPVLVAGIAHSGTAIAQDAPRISPAVTSLTAGLFCAPQDTGRRDAPGTISGWIHVPDRPVEMRRPGREAPTVLGTGFGVRFSLDIGTTVQSEYVVTHPPIPPSNATEQRWLGTVSPGEHDTVFFQFDTEEEMQPGVWTFTVNVGGQEMFYMPFTIRPATDLPGLATLCQVGDLLTFIPTAPAEAG